MAGVEHKQVSGDEAGMRLDRWFKVHYPGLGFGPLQKLLRSGQIRIDGGRVKSDSRVQPGQTIRISAGRVGGEIRITVADDGRGIPDEVKEEVFDRFESHSLGSRHRGVGLGLSIVRSIVELHGGRIELESAPGAGTRVTAVFPPEGMRISDAAE